jgi:hypothetical protein
VSERVRGFATWEPRAKSRRLLDQVHAVLAEYAAHLPLTVRQVFYRLVGGHGYDKTELAYDRLGELLNRARRAGLVDFDAIRDGGVTALWPLAFAGPQDFVLKVRQQAADYRLDRQHGQQRYLELWVEAAGMTEMLFQAVGSYGVPVLSCGGFDSLTAKHKAACRIAGRDVPTLVLHVGDHDPSGLALFQAAASDVQAMAGQLGGEVEVQRVAITPEQITRHSLPTAPAKAHDKRSAWQGGGGTVQAEALPPDVLLAEVRQAVVSRIDPAALDAVRRREGLEGLRLAVALDRLREAGEGQEA